MRLIPPATAGGTDKKSADFADYTDGKSIKNDLYPVAITLHAS
ncbi:MAG TPA: hypothetical protein VGJ48_20750 [Pyrinomonadaceae bacterium]